MLTDTKLRTLKPKAALYRVADSNGLCIEVSPSGSRLWRFRFRFNGKASMLALGDPRRWCLPGHGRQGTQGGAGGARD